MMRDSWSLDLDPPGSPAEGRTLPVWLVCGLWIAALVVGFLAGTTAEVGGNRERIHEGVLTIYTTHNYGRDSDIHKYPLANIKSWSWEKG